VIARVPHHFYGSFFAPQGEKSGALWATKEEKEHSAEGYGRDRVSPIIKYRKEHRSSYRAEAVFKFGMNSYRP
jgi:hypothetical protein